MNIIILLVFIIQKYYELFGGNMEATLKGAFEIKLRIGALCSARTAVAVVACGYD